MKPPAYDPYYFGSGIFGRPSEVLEHEFVQTASKRWPNSSIVMTTLSYSLKSSLKSVMSRIDATLSADASGWTVIDTGLSKQLFYRRTESLMIMIQFPGDSHFDYFAESAGTWEFKLFGVVGNVQMAVDTLNSLFRDEQAPSVRWHYVGAHGGTYEDISLTPEDRRDTRDSFYPWLEGGVESYLQRYTNSTAPILLMAGPPGSGKTTLLRHFLFRYQTMGYRAHISYDERILNSDSVFIEFITDRKPSVLIVEDADVLLTSRESDANKMISRFLNVSDGLIPLHHKKIVFTTNLSDFQRIDSALTRPGRCFDFMKCRALTAAEAEVVANEIGRPALGREATLAEIFNQKSNIESPRMGFIR